MCAFLVAKFCYYFLLLNLPIYELEKKMTRWLKLKAIFEFGAKKYVKINSKMLYATILSTV